MRLDPVGSAAWLPTEEPRRIAAKVAKLLELLRKEWRAAGELPASKTKFDFEFI